MAAEIETIDVQTLRERQQTGNVRMVDVRTPAEHRAVHAKGVTLMPLDAFKPGELPMDEPVYFLCKSGGRAKQAAAKFQAAGGRAVVVEGGTEAWDAAGLPVERGKQTMSLERQVRIAAGTLVVIGVVLGWLVHPLFLILSAFVGSGLVFAGVTDTCGMGMLLAKMPWNRVGGEATTAQPVPAAA